MPTTTCYVHRCRWCDRIFESPVERDHLCGPCADALPDVVEGRTRGYDGCDDPAQPRGLVEHPCYVRLDRHHRAEPIQDARRRRCELAPPTGEADEEDGEERLTLGDAAWPRTDYEQSFETTANLLYNQREGL